MAKVHHHRGMLFAVIPLLILGLIFTALCGMTVSDLSGHSWFRWPDYLLTGCLAAAAGMIALVGYIGAACFLCGGLIKCTSDYTSCCEILDGASESFHSASGREKGGLG